VIVGYSGGADSTFLLHALHGCGIDLVAAHLHHGMRPEADDEMKRCEAFADSLGVPFAGGRADVPKMARELRIGIEEAGRRARYEFLQRAAIKCRGDLIATAHTLDDHVETVLLNLTRGSGLSGLAGIPAGRDNVVRPALPFMREETRAYCKEAGLWFHDDPANSDVAFSRTRIRLKVVPELREINPAFDEAVARMAEIVGEEDRFLNATAAAALERCEVPLNGALRFLTADCEVAFDRAALASLPPVLVKRAIRLAAGAIGGALDYGQTATVCAGLSEGGSGSVTAEGGRVAVEWNAESVTVRDVAPAEPFRFPLTVPGETLSEEFGWQITAAYASPEEYSRERRALSVVVDATAVKGEPYFRAAEPGDALAPLGMAGRRKLSDFLGEAGLTHAARRRLPVVCDMVGPIWVPGVCMADRVKITGNTRRALELRFGPQSPDSGGRCAT
jgi:tRNA(Ile)-lysidine synthase